MLPEDPITSIQNDLQVLDHSMLLEIYPYPAFIYNRTFDQIPRVNQKFLELTRYAESQVPELTLSTLISSQLDTNPTGDTTRPIKLKIASGDLIHQNLRILPLSLTNQVVLLSFSPPGEEAYLRKDLLEQEIIYDNFSLLTQVAGQTSLKGVYEMTAWVVDRLVNPKTIAAYFSSKDTLTLHRLALPAHYESNQFSEELKSEELLNLPVLHLWKSNKKPVSPLHDYALIKGYQYLLTIPLVFKGKMQGMLIAAGTGIGPNDEVLRYISLLSSITSSTLHHLSGLESAQRTLQRMRQVVQIEHAITDNLEEGVIVLTPDLQIAEMSPSAEIMLGYASKEVFLQRVEMVLIGNETLSSMYKSAQRGISTLVGNNLSLNTRNGKTFLAQVLCIPVMTDEELTSVVLILRDLSQTEQIQARTQTLEQRAFLGEISAIFAHEVKNPINSLQTGLQYIGMTMQPEDPHFDLVNRLQNDCQRLTHLMDSTLTFSKPIEYHFNPLDLGALIPSILDRWAPRMTRLGINHNFLTNPEHPMVMADSRALEQVFVNLISNAIQAMDNNGGTLTIKINPYSDGSNPPQYEVIVADSGPGISDELKQHIFEPFITTNASGTGLGLAITKRIVTAHKGNIFLESYPGGTMFHIHLPRAQ
ncbi:MAG: PAS domain-containing protein [Chloroflexi bacterium]|nr:PAS domain-containing protein [Chloroflexota bacterium]